MSIDVSPLVGPGEVLAITEEVWSALVGDPDTLVSLAQPLPADVVSAWVLVVGPWSGSLVITCAPATARELTRCVLRAPDEEELADEDVADALGEVANVLGGGVKSLLPEPSSLGLPQTGPGMAAPTGWAVVALDLSWRGSAISISLRSAARAADPGTPTPPKEPS